MIAVLHLLAFWLAFQAHDATGEGLAFVELSAARTSCFVEECVRVQIEFGLEETFLREKVVQPFGTKLAMPVQLSARWLDDAAVRPVETADGATFVRNETVRSAFAEGVRVVDGRRYVACRQDVDLLPTAVGELRLEGPVLSFAYATRFEESFLQGRAPVDRVDAFVSGKPIALEVRPLPEAGRPPEFTGAVGSFSARAEVEPATVLLGESLKLRLAIEGRGNLTRFEPPRFSEIGGFRVLGMIEEPGAGSRTFTFDLAPVSAQVWQVPGIAFAYFDPEPPGSYRIARTQPIDVVVRPRPDSRPAIPARPPEPGLAAWPILLAPAAAALLLLLWLGMRWRKRAR